MTTTRMDDLGIVISLFVGGLFSYVTFFGLALLLEPSYYVEYFVWISPLIFLVPVGLLLTGILGLVYAGRKAVEDLVMQRSFWFAVRKYSLRSITLFWLLILVLLGLTFMIIGDWDLLLIPFGGVALHFVWNFLVAGPVTVGIMRLLVKQGGED